MSNVIPLPTALKRRDDRVRDYSAWLRATAPFPTALKRRDDRVQAVCDAVAHGKAVRPLVDAEEVDGTVRITVGDLELGVDPAEALAIANRIATAAGDAITRRRRDG